MVIIRQLLLSLKPSSNFFILSIYFLQFEFSLINHQSKNQLIKFNEKLSSFPLSSIFKIHIIVIKKDLMNIYNQVIFAGSDKKMLFHLNIIQKLQLLIIGLTYQQIQCPIFNIYFMELSKNLMTPQRKRSRFSKFQSQAQYKQRIDQLHKHDFQLIRQEKLGSEQKLQFSKNNSIILQYVKSIYNEFSIPDPLGQINLSYLSSEPSGIKTIKKQKIHLMSNHTLKYSTTPRNVSSILSEYPLNNTQLDGLRSNLQSKNDSYKLNTTFQQHLDPESNRNNRKNQSLTDLFSKLKILKENDQNIDYLLLKNNKNRPKMEMIIEQQAKITLQDEDQYQNRQLEQAPINQARNEVQKTTRQIQETFRYCIGCQRQIIQNNIQLHEAICDQFQTMFSMSEDEMDICLCEKVEAMKQKAQKYLESIYSEEIDIFKQASLKLADQAKNILRKGQMTNFFRKEYFKALQISKKWCLISQQVNKIHWFLMIISRKRSNESK